MKVVLLELVDKLGRTGDIVEVRKGYARNYLLPKKLAMHVTPGTLKMVEMLKEQKIKKSMKSKEEAEELQKTLEGLSVTARVKASEQEKLYGSVSERDITHLLEEQHGVKLDYHNILMDEHIKKLGSFNVKIMLHSEIEFNLPVWVVRQEEKE